MPFDGITTYAVVEELTNTLVHGRINKIYQPESDEILLSINNKGSKYNLLLSANNNNPRIHLTTGTKDNPLAPPMFCMLLRKNIQGATILEVNQVSLDRIVEIRIGTTNELGDPVTKKIVIEIMGRHSNIILINEPEGIIVDSIKRVGKNISSFREVLPGKTYKTPPQNKTEPRGIGQDDFIARLNNYAQNKSISKFIMDTFIGVSRPLSYELCYRAEVDSDTPVAQLCQKGILSVYEKFAHFYGHLTQELQPTMYTNQNKSKAYDFSAVDLTYYEQYTKTVYSSVSALLEEYYSLRDSLERIKSKSSSMMQMLNNKLERDYHKLDKQMTEMQKAVDAEIYRKYGELITSQIYQLEQGQESAVLMDYYTGEEIEIPLSPQLTPAENAQKYFKKYNKGKRAKAYLKEQIALAKDEIYYLESQVDNIRKCTEIEEFNEIREELIENGYIKARNQGKKKKKERQHDPSKPMKFIHEGIAIYVGKNNKQNEYLTTRFANKTDLWLHVKDIPGSHVIVKKQWDQVDDNLLTTAALLAAYFSKGRESSNVAVDYTAVKYVRKPKGAKTGMVIYTDQKTVYVTPEEEDVLKIEREA